MKIAFVGGGSVQWTPKLVTDMALTGTLAGANLVLHDIDADALDLLTRACERISAEAGETLQVTSTLDRAEALRDAGRTAGGKREVHGDGEWLTIAEQVSDARVWAGGL
jgi:alpha-galactosidase/6-phospho-beta-glucosidase family protein